MKKKLTMAVVAFLLAVFPAMARDAKHYSDKANGYGGVACARFEEPIMTFYCDRAGSHIKKDMEKQGYIVTRPLSKLSNEEVFLVWNALCEYDLIDGEVYSVFVQCENRSECLSLVAEICNNRKSFRCYGGCYCKEK